MPGGFSSFMIPFGSTMGSTLNTFNSYGQQMLNNRLQQQEMQLQQQREMLDQQRFRLDDARGRFDMQREAAQQQEKIRGMRALGSTYAQVGQMQSDPTKRRGYDAMANAAMNGVPDEQVQEIGRAFGIGPADLKDDLTRAEIAEHSANATYTGGLNRMYGFTGGGGGAPSGGGGVGGPSGVGPSGIVVSPDGTQIWKDGKVYPAPWATGGSGGGGGTP